MKHRSMYVVGAAIAAAAGAAAYARADQAAQRAVDPKADALLRAMSTQLAKMQTFTVEASHSTEVVTEDGWKIQVVGESDVAVERPNKLRSERMGLIAHAVLYYDGKNLSLYGKRANLYATTPAPDTIDKTIDFARSRLDLDAPAADLLYSNPYSVLMEDVVSGRYIGKEPIGNRICHHLAYRGNETDWQIWIEDGAQPLPCRFEVTSKKVEGQPEYVVEMNNWNIDPTLSPETFEFTPPRGARRIDFMAARQAKQENQEMELR